MSEGAIIGETGVLFYAQNNFSKTISCNALQLLFIFGCGSSFKKPQPLSGVQISVSVDGVRLGVYTQTKEEWEELSPPPTAALPAPTPTACAELFGQPRSR